MGAIPTDDAVRAGVLSVYAPGAAFGWTTDDGHCHVTPDTFVLVVRGLYALLEEATDASSAALREWLPPPAELLRIAEYECVWRATPLGAAHPALLGARLHGERLGSWEAAAEVVEGVLAIEEFQPLLRTEVELGDRAAACEAAERAAAEAAGAGYVWLEMLSLGDMVGWCAEGEVEGVRSRLCGVVGRLAATEAEVAGVLGEGALG
eukprot:3669078-Prymnesium_polylepis.2